MHRTVEHLWLVAISLLFSIVIGVPLGIAAVRYHATGQAILLLSAMIQTVPSLALLCFLDSAVWSRDQAGAGGLVPVQSLPVV